MKKIYIPQGGGRDFWLRIPMNNESAGRHLCMDDVDENEMHVWLESGYGGCWTLVWEKDGAQRDGIAAKVPASQLGYGTYSVVMAGKFVNGDSFRTKRQLFIRLVDREDQADAEPTMYNEEQAYWAGPAVLSEMLSRDGLNTYELWILQGNEGSLEDYLSVSGLTLNDFMVQWNHLSVDVQSKIDRAEQTAINPKGDYDEEVEYHANDLVYDSETLSSYVSLLSHNTGNPVTDTTYWMKVLDGDDINQIERDAETLLANATDAANNAAAAANLATSAAEHVVAQKVAQAQVGYYTCNTVAGTATKATTSNLAGTDQYSPASGGAVKIKMAAANTSTDTVYLQFGSDTNTKKPLYYNGLAVDASNSWENNEVISVYFDPSANSNAGAYFASNAQGGGGKAEKIKYDNSQSGLLANNVQGALDEIEDNFVFENTILTENASISYGISFISTQVNFEPNKRYKIIVSLAEPQSGRISIYLSNIGSASGNVHQYIGSINAGDSSIELYYDSDSANIYKYIYFYTEAHINTTASVQVYELSKHNLDSMSQDIDAIKDIVGTDILLEKNNGLDYTLTNGYINLNGEAVVPSNNDWGKTDDFLPIPENATVFSLENCKGHGSIATIAFYSAQSVNSLVSVVKIPNPSDIIFSYPKSPIPDGALYYRVSFGYNNANLSTQYILFYEDSTIKTTVELLDNNIGTSYNGNTLFATHYIRKATSFNFEYLYIEKGGSVSISSDIASSLNIYYCSNSQTWDANDYESIVLHTSTNPYNYTFTKSAGCIRIYNDGTSDINVTIQYKRNTNASQQIKINEDIIGRIVERVGGIQDSFAQSYFFREPVTGSLARVWTSNTLTQASKEKEWLVLYCHGNSDLIENSTIPQTALDYFRANKINVAAIQYQDLNNTGIVGDGFNKYAWGNYTQFAHVIALYNYMQSHYNLHKTVVIAGISMGGLAMGALAYKKTFPIAFCLGVGAVPSLKKMWDNGGEQRRVPIRAAYGMAADGSDDANVDTFFEGHDWWNMGMLTIGTDKYKIGFPNVYLYYGVDSVFNTDFGGLQTYSELCQSLLNGGVYSKIERVGDGHANPEIWTRSVVEDIWHNELGVPSYTE